MNTFTEREQIIETINKLFVYTDYMKWQQLQQEVFTEEVLFDMSSLGSPIKTMSAKAICDAWSEGFKDLDSVNHLAGNILVTIKEKDATVFAYATATHYKQAATKGKTREFVGSYDIHLTNTDAGWRIDQFKYNLKFISGNADLS